MANTVSTLKSPQKKIQIREHVYVYVVRDDLTSNSILIHLDVYGHPGGENCAIENFVELVAACKFVKRATKQETSNSVAIMLDTCAHWANVGGLIEQMIARAYEVRQTDVTTFPDTHLKAVPRRF